MVGRHVARDPWCLCVCVRAGARAGVHDARPMSDACGTLVSWDGLHNKGPEPHYTPKERQPGMRRNEKFINDRTVDCKSKRAVARSHLRASHLHNSMQRTRSRRQHPLFANERARIIHTQLSLDGSQRELPKRERFPEAHVLGLRERIDLNMATNIYIYIFMEVS